jgi:hypothetical protein
MQLLITTQVQENYAAHQGFTGEYYWKFKGGNDYKFDLGTLARNAEALAELVEYFRTRIEEDNDYFRNHIIGWEVVSDDYLTEFEQSQLDYEGSITYPATRLELETV